MELLNDIKKYIKNQEITDDFINNRIDSILHFIKEYTHNPFYLKGSKFISNGNFSEKNIIITTNIKDYNYNVDDNIIISNSVFNDGIYKITNISEDGKIITVDTLNDFRHLKNNVSLIISIVDYPKSLINIIADMIEYDFNREFSNLTSESVSRQSYSYKDNYPQEILLKLNIFFKFSF